MKTLFLLRHAKADRDLFVIRDVERPLTERGYSDARLISTVLQEQALVPEKIISSPAVRAYSTALIFAGTFGMPTDSITLETKLYDSSSNDYIGVIRALDDRYASCLLAGHNDVITDVASLLLKPKPVESMKTCGLVILSSESDSWKNFTAHPCELVLALYPALFRES